MTEQQEHENIFEFRDVHKGFGAQQVLRGLNLKVPNNKISFIIGRSGEGKSVTLKHIVGILKPDAGEVVIDGQSMANASREDWIAARRKIGLLFQDGALFDSMSVFENVSFPLREFKTKNEDVLRQDVAELLELVGLPGRESAFPAQLSIGEKKRVGLARALALRPKLLLYDEPTTSMDPLISELIDDLILSTQKKVAGISSVVVSHDVRSILEIADHIILIHEGKNYLEGPPELFKTSRDPLIRQFVEGRREGPLANVIA